MLHDVGSINVNWFEAALLGLVQGLTEFLPISSSAHLRIVGSFLPNAADPGAAFTAITQLGTETAVIVYFWRDIVRIVKAWFGSLARQGLAAGSRRPDGLAGDPGQPAHHRPGPAVPGPDRVGAAQPVDRRHHADRLRPDPGRGGRRREAGPRPQPASPTSTASSTDLPRPWRSFPACRAPAAPSRPAS